MQYAWRPQVEMYVRGRGSLTLRLYPERMYRQRGSAEGDLDEVGHSSTGEKPDGDGGLWQSLASPASPPPTWAPSPLVAVPALGHGILYTTDNTDHVRGLGVRRWIQTTGLTVILDWPRRHAQGMAWKDWAARAIEVLDGTDMSG